MTPVSYTHLPGLFEDPAEIGLYDAIGELRSDLAVCEQESSDGFVERDAYVCLLYTSRCV